MYKRSHQRTIAQSYLCCSHPATLIDQKGSSKVNKFYVSLGRRWLLSFTRLIIKSQVLISWMINGSTCFCRESSCSLTILFECRTFEKLWRYFINWWSLDPSLFCGIVRYTNNLHQLSLIWSLQQCLWYRQSMILIRFWSTNWLHYQLSSIKKNICIRIFHHSSVFIVMNGQWSL